jgi:hypothetical protein
MAAQTSIINAQSVAYFSETNEALAVMTSSSDSTRRGTRLQPGILSSVVTCRRGGRKWAFWLDDMNLTVQSAGPSRLGLQANDWLA